MCGCAHLRVLCVRVKERKRVKVFMCLRLCVCACVCVCVCVCLCVLLYLLPLKHMELLMFFLLLIMGVHALVFALDVHISPFLSGCHQLFISPTQTHTKYSVQHNKESTAASSVVQLLAMFG